MTIAACPTPRGYSLTPEGWRPKPCRRLACPYCGPRIALSTVKAIELANPIGSALVTLKAPATEDRARLRAFARVLGLVAADLCGDGFTWEYAWILELTPSGTPNVHALQRGSPVTSLRFRRALAVAGGKGDLQPVRHVKILARYVLKLALAGLDVPEIDAAAAMNLHLRLNGGVLLHSSRRFWTDGSGGALPGVVSARAKARLLPTGRRPTPEELTEWRAGWKLPRSESFRERAEMGSVVAMWAPVGSKLPSPRVRARRGRGEACGEPGANFRVGSATDTGRVQELSLADIRRLVTDGAQEGSSLEFKRELSLAASKARVEALKDLSGMGKRWRRNRPLRRRRG